MPAGNGGTKTEWPTEWTEMLKELWASGISASAIAKKMNCGVSKNAVIGKAHRLGLPRRDAALATSNYCRSRSRAPTGSGPYAGQHTRKKELAAGAPRRERVAKPKPPKPRALGELFGPPAPPPRLADMKLIHLAGYNECRWPAFQSADGHLFCCAPTMGKSSYCREHAALSVGRRLSPLTAGVVKFDQGRPGFYEGDFPAEVSRKVA